jgi:hypothetical protein
MFFMLVQNFHFCLHITHCRSILFLLPLSSHRYELCFSGEKPRSVGPNSNASDIEVEKNRDRGEHEHRDVFRWSRCKKAMPEIAMRSIGIPLPAEHVEVGCFLVPTSTPTSSIISSLWGISQVCSLCAGICIDGDNSSKYVCCVFTLLGICRY